MRGEDESLIFFNYRHIKDWISTKNCSITTPCHNLNMASATSFRELIGVQPSSASLSDSVLIIIDAQNEYAEGKLQVTNVAESRKVIAALLEKYRSANGDIVHVVHATPEGAPVFTPGTKLAEEFDELKPKDGEAVIEKNFPGSFAKTDLQDVLDKTGKKKVVLTGYMVSKMRSWRGLC
jgi:hypothetical protein